MSERESDRAEWQPSAERAGRPPQRTFAQPAAGFR
jgi:hypothetical protein